jgi:hypothetical protein
MNVIGAAVAGLVGTAIFTMILAMAPRMGMPKMDIVGLLSTMFGKENRLLGWMMHLMMGVIFALIYAFLWSKGVLPANWLGGLVLGAVHWLIVGMIMGMMPMIHRGMRSGEVMAPGPWMSKGGGMLAFAGGLMGHMIFGVVVALVYSAL